VSEHLVITGKSSLQRNWKEYFSILSQDWAVQEVKLTSIPDVPAPPPDVAALFLLGEQLHHNQTLIRVVLKKKSRGIEIEPPWIPQYQVAAEHMEASAGHDRARTALSSALVERDEARAELGAALKVLAAIRNSTSWEVTSPFRKLTNWYRGSHSGSSVI
jgi:hypothetical protein